VLEIPHLLVVCGQNKRRSRTAEYLFKNDKRLRIRSVGLSPKSERQISERDIEWSDIILVMEDSHASRIGKLYRHMDVPPIDIMFIDDIYAYRDPELVELLERHINSVLEQWHENEET
jgi:protein-tyrosine phosphatase